MMTTMGHDPFWSARRRLTRADHHIAELRIAVAAHFETKPYTFVEEVRGEMAIHSLRLAPLPSIVTDLAFDAVSNLRAALDHAVVAVVARHKPEREKSVYFPIVRYKLSEHIRQKAYHKALPPDVLASIEALEPYFGGAGHFLWELDQARKQAEHREIVTCGMWSWTQLEPIVGIPSPEWQLLPSHPISDGGDAAFAVGPANTNCPFWVTPALEVTFGGDVEGVGGQPLLTRLAAFRDCVDHAISTVQAAAERVWLSD